MSPREALQLDGLERATSPVQEILKSSLFEPIDDLFNRPSKNVRATLVRAGYLLAGESEGGTTVCETLAHALEAIHAGSLIIDDIQDGSRERRGAPSLHEKYGMPIALNAGNYLYFQPFEMIRSLALPSLIELRLYRLCHEAMLTAHKGQALDLGADIAEMSALELEDLCHQTSLMKTGALMSLALCLGATAAGADDETIVSLRTLGETLGVALQRFDDIGNLTASDEKRFEDLRLRRPSWAWALAARSPRYREFVDGASSSALTKTWIVREKFLEFARKENEIYLDRALTALDPFRHRRVGCMLIREMGDTLRRAYGK